MNATCPDRGTLEAYLLGSLEDDVIDVHLDTCAECQANVDELEAVVNRPFAALKIPPAAEVAWEEPAYQRLLAGAKAMRLGGLESAETEPLPRRLGDYQLLELVAVSGMGRVYKAQHLHLKKTVAVKLIAPWLVRSADARQRFRREMQAVGILVSPHIVTAFDAGEVDGVDFLAMEYIDGNDLHALVGKNGPLPIAQAIDFTLQAARGLAVAHAAGIVHRDVKPRNLLLDQSGNVKVLDLGLALFLSEANTSDGGVGTANFMAPEQKSDRTVDARADVYGLGCTLYYLLTGQVPNHAARPLRALRPDCPRALDILIGRMIAEAPQARPASMCEVGAELERLQRPARRLIGWPGLVAACVLLSVGALLLAYANIGQPEPTKNGKSPGDAKTAMPKPGATPAIDMKRIEPGDFWIGASDADPRAKQSELPRVKVKINRAFFLGATEVTQEQYEEVIGKNPSAFSKSGSAKDRVKGLDTRKHPVESVSWLDAIRFCNKLSERHELPSYYKIDKEVVTIAGGPGYRLPTEAEWEYACRAGTTSTWHFGEKAEDLRDHAWFAENSEDRTHPVAKKKANPWGLYDMYGNVPEWCWDRFDPKYYSYMPASDPPGSGTKNLRSVRGDGWNSRLPRTPARDGLGFTYGSENSIHIIGFRVARNVE